MNLRVFDFGNLFAFVVRIGFRSAVRLLRRSFLRRRLLRFRARFGGGGLRRCVVLVLPGRLAVREPRQEVVLSALLRSGLRIAGGDLNAWAGLLGFAGGIYAGIFFLNRGYSLKRTYKMTTIEGSLLPIVALALLALLVAAPAFIHFTKAGGGPGAKHAAIAISLLAGLAVGALAQRTRFCMIAGIRDFILFRETKMLWGFIAVTVAALLCNLTLSAVTGASFFKLGFAGQPIAHTDGLWNALGLFLAGFACVLLGGCPMRQLILAGEGNSDSAIAVLGLVAGAAFAHNFGLASSGAGPTLNGQIAVVIGILVVGLIGYLNTYKK